MSGRQTSPHHIAGIAAAIVAAAMIFLAWSFGVPFLEGTPFSELRYLVFFGFAVLLLSALQAAFDRFHHSD